jgi:hypothetical protein
VHACAHSFEFSCMLSPSERSYFGPLMVRDRLAVPNAFSTSLTLTNLQLEHCVYCRWSLLPSHQATTAGFAALPPAQHSQNIGTCKFSGTQQHLASDLRSEHRACIAASSCDRHHVIHWPEPKSEAQKVCDGALLKTDHRGQPWQRRQDLPTCRSSQRPPQAGHDQLCMHARVD